MTDAVKGLSGISVRLLAYWAATIALLAESFIGGVADLLHLDPYFAALQQLGYPDYLATLLGAAKILAGLVVLAPGLPRLKEWAYAGILINMLGAAFSQIAAGNGPSDWSPPLAIAGLALASWALRPTSRRLTGALL
jgi:uncharacterized membrane protein YphA (DoxX/SURF4 family)